jgi:hypothetical protein
VKRIGRVKPGHPRAKSSVDVTGGCGTLCVTVCAGGSAQPLFYASPPYALAGFNPVPVYVRLKLLLTLPRRFQRHDDPICRLAFCKCASAIASSALDAAFLKDVHVTLLQAFHDESDDVRALATTFWQTASAAHSTTPASLLIWLLDTLPAGADFVALATFLLLTLSEKSVALDRPLSEVPLSDTIHYATMNVDGTWRPHTDPMLTPLYSTLETASQPLMVPATPDPDFTLTQVTYALRTASSRYI